MKRTCQKLCGYLQEEARLTLGELAGLPDDVNGLHVAEAALKLRDAIAAIRHSKLLIETAKAQRADRPSEVQGVFDGEVQP